MRNLVNLQHKLLQKGNQSGGIKFKSSQKGFTLLEIMIVVAIIGILASIAMPAYTDYVKKGKAAEATATLASLRVQMEQYFQDNRTYVGGPCAPTSGAKFFAYTCSVAASATTYTLQAAGSSAEDMGNFNFTVNQDNAKTSTYDGTSGNCWLTKKGGAC